VAGTATLALVWARRFEPARYTAAVAVAAIVAGWALAQSPRLLPGLSVRQAAASHDTLVAVLVAVVAGGALLLPSLATLFRLALGGRLTEGATADEAISGSTPLPRSGWLVRAAVALLIAGIGLVNVADAEWAHLVGAACFLACIATAFRAAVPLT
jgi:cytochrome d ubiquinol oxidase subunit II